MAGVTRLADITGLDRIGIPCTLAVRPNAATLVGSSGKGTTFDAAAASGLMEAIEIHHAEQPMLDTSLWSYRQLEQQGAAVAPIDRLPHASGSHFTPDLRFEWVWGFDLIGQVDTAVPYATVELRAQAPRSAARGGDGLFQASSNGLASGNSLLEAITAGVYEVIERDAKSMNALAVERGHREQEHIDLDSVTWPEVNALIDRCRAADIRLFVADITADTDVATYQATIVDERERGIGAFGGSGTHLDPQIAMIRAITEAAQSRAVIIAGSRDDMFTCEKRRSRRFDNEFVNARRNAQPTVVRPRASEAQSSFEGDLSVLFAKLERVGLDQVIVVDLRQPAFGVDVVRVVIPGLEGHNRFPFYAPGERARRLLDR